MQKKTADISWRPGNVPVSTRFDDPYFSLENGLAETRHVFLDGNNLPERFHDRFHIAELGFGTGLNFLTTLQAWRATGLDACLRFTSFEAFPMEGADMALALSVFPELEDLKTQLLQCWTPEGGVFDLGPLAQLEVIVGDARQTVTQWDGQADAWYLDGFSPAKNPELWSDELLQDVAHATAPGGTCATYTAAGFVRRRLGNAGFEVTRVSGFGRKRHMTTGVLRG